MGRLTKIVEFPSLSFGSFEGNRGPADPSRLLIIFMRHTLPTRLWCRYCGGFATSPTSEEGRLDGAIDQDRETAVVVAPIT